MKSKLIVFLANGDKLTFENATTEVLRSGALCILEAEHYTTEMLLAPGQWTHVKMERVPA